MLPYVCDCYATVAAAKGSMRTNTVLLHSWVIMSIPAVCLHRFWPSGAPQIRPPHKKKGSVVVPFSSRDEACDEYTGIVQGT